MLKIEYAFDIDKAEKVKHKELTIDRGVYILYDAKDNPLFIGQSGILSYQLNAHFTGNSNLRRYTGLIHSFSVIYESNESLRLLLKRYLLIELSPKLNSKRWVASAISDNEDERGDSCMGITSLGKKCNIVSNTNGYCRFHGGNGISRLTDHHK